MLHARRRRRPRCLGPLALCGFLVLPAAGHPAGSGVTWLDDRFELASGLRIYRAADRELTGGSYALCFDGEGRILVGDGKAVRRLEDTDGDGVLDRAETIAEGLGPRGPQGLAVVGDRLWAVGGDGLQCFTGYRGGAARDGDGPGARRAGRLERAGRAGAPFRTGGDHHAHTVMRGLDDWLYLVVGDGAGARDRVHITEATSPCPRERKGSVFRISPDGERWECIGTGARNSPNLGMHPSGELFGLDSDMEWHVGLPWWRPVRLHHWVVGGDQGWESVGAHPPGWPDSLPGILDVGRGSPCWGVLYDHEGLPERYRGAFMVCDYRWKSATTGGYATGGRLLAFRLAPAGGTWRATLDVIARPRPGARDGDGRPIDFALVDVAVGPDGSLWLTERGRGIWRIVHDPEGARTADGAPPVRPRMPDLPEDDAAALEALLVLPQPLAEWSRRRRERLLAVLEDRAVPALLEVAGDGGAPLERRVDALGVLASRFESLPLEALARLGRADEPLVRGFAAWLLGLRGGEREALLLAGSLLDDPSAHVRRRALEGLHRARPPADRLHRVVDRLDDPDPTVRYAAMTALSLHPVRLWLDDALGGGGASRRVRALIAADRRGELPGGTRVLEVLERAAAETGTSARVPPRIAVLRALGRFRPALERAEGARELVRDVVLEGFPAADAAVRREQVRLAGAWGLEAAFAPLVELLVAEEDPVAAFAAARALARIPARGPGEAERAAVRWFLEAQEGWFARHKGKGRQWPHFWATVLADFVRHHEEALVAKLDEVRLDGTLGDVLLDRVAERPDAAELLGELLATRERPAERRRVLGALGAVPSPAAGRVLRDAVLRLRGADERAAALIAIARRPPDPEARPWLEEGLFHEDPDVVRACALALARLPGEPAEDICRTLLARMARHPSVVRAGERLLARLAGDDRPGRPQDVDPRREAGAEERRAAIAHWARWFEETFGTEFRPPEDLPALDRSDEELRRLLLSDDVAGGNARRGRRIYEQLCARCHGGIEHRAAVLFGPDLAGATRRFTREELVESLVDPSRTVPDRYRGESVVLRDGTALAGFVTRDDEDGVVLVTKDRVRRLVPGDIARRAPQEESLMPRGLLNRLPRKDIADLMATLEELGAREPRVPPDAREAPGG